MARLVKRGPEGGTLSRRPRTRGGGLRADRGGDSDETALVAKPSSLRAVQVVATEFNFEAYKTDIKAAYLNEEYIPAASRSTSAR